MRFHFDRFEFRNAKLSEWKELTALEKVCFPPNEACTSEQLRQRIEKASENFFVACDQVNPKLAGFLCGICSDEPRFRDEFFMDAALHEPAGKTVYLLGLNVSPEYRHHGLATALMDRYIERERRAAGRRWFSPVIHISSRSMKASASRISASETPAGAVKAGMICGSPSAER